VVATDGDRHTRVGKLIRKRASSRIGWVAVLAASLYVVPAALLWGMQDAVIFPAPRYTPMEFDERALQLGAKPLFIPTADGGSLYAWHTPSAGDRLVIYFHGNASTPAEGSMLRKPLLELGYGILAPTYRGYGPNQGRPSEAGLIEDARASWRYATKELGYAPGNIVLHGVSLGGGVATALASEVHPRALVLECTFSSVREVAAARYPIFPVGLLLRHPFDSVARAPNVHAPTLVVHGDQDNVVPVEHGRRLAGAFPDARYVEVPGMGHNVGLIVSGGEAFVAWTRLLDEP
jgi:fermentation-respiration switch protein FrsA (DUF1100 family)